MTHDIFVVVAAVVRALVYSTHVMLALAITELHKIDEQQRRINGTFSTVLIAMRQTR